MSRFGHHRVRVLGLVVILGGLLFMAGAGPASASGDTATENAPLTAGGYQTCGLTPSGGANCWGYGNHGQTADQVGPYTQISAGGFHNCGLTPSGAADCWGNNSFGQAADQVGPYIQITSGAYHHNCGLTPSGAADCWGYNGYGQAVDQVGPYTQISGGYYHTCALTTAGDADCWGDLADENLFGQTVDRTGPYVQISAGGFHNCGLTPSGAADCWGSDVYGEAGFHAGPYTQISVGYFHTCGLTPSGAADCWGSNAEGQAGFHAGPYTQLTAGGRHSCGLTPLGEADCWGYDVDGQLTEDPGPYGLNTSGDIAFTSNRDGNFEIYVMNADGSGQTRLTVDGAADSCPAFSPDGSRIAFMSTRNGAEEIYVMNANGTGQTRLTNNTAADACPSWSPDGTRIAFTSYRDGNAEIYVMNADGSGQTRLTNNAAYDDEAYWSADGTKIAFLSGRDGDYEIFVMNATDGTGQANLTNNSVNDASPAWSPDGTKIAFASDRDSNFEIYVMNADGTGQTRRTTNAAYDDRPSWSPGGSMLAFERDLGANYEIFVMNADGTGQANRTNNAARDFAPSWGPTAALDTTAPDTSIVGGPTGLVNSGSAGFGLESSEPGGSFECELDDTGFAACVSPKNYSGLADGSHTFKVRATDAAGNTDPTAATRTWTVDTTAPVIALHVDVTEEATSGAGALVTYTSPSTSDAVDGAGSATCAPASGTVFVLGDTTVTCNASDAAGNAATATTFEVSVVDTTAPVIALHVNVTEETTSGAGALVTYTSPSTSDAVDGAGSATCAPASGTVFVLGDTTVTCNASDAAGNAATPTTFKVSVVDTTAPDTSISGVIDGEGSPVVSGGSTLSQVARFSFTGQDVAGVSDFQCKLDDGAFATCTTPTDYTDLVVGSHTFEVRAIDAAGNVDSSPASFTWSVVTPAQAIDSSITTINTMGLPTGVASSLAAPLKSASVFLNDTNPNNDGAVCGKINAFVNQVNAKAQSGKLTMPQKEQLIEAADAIKGSLGC